MFSRNRLIPVWLTRMVRGIAFSGCLVAFGMTGMAEGPGQGDFDEAVAKKLTAKSLEELDQVATLIESALAKGLEDADAEFARQMLGGVNMQKAQEILSRLPRGGGNPVALNRLRNNAIESLEKAVKYDPTLAEAHLLIARLNLLPGGNVKRGLEATSAAIEQLAGEPKKLCEALLMRSVFQEDATAKKADLDRAIEVDPDNLDAWQARASFLIQANQPEEAIADLKKLIERQPENINLVRAAAIALRGIERFDEARALLSEAIERVQDPALYQLRAEIAHVQKDSDAALADVDEALKREPRSLESRLLRAEILLQKDDVSGAKRDLEAAMSEQPNSVQGLLMRGIIAAQEGRLQDAINDMKMLVRAFPDNPQLVMQLANYYQMDNRPRQAIETLDGLLAADPNNWRALRIRGDARLSIGEHAKAIEDYEVALKHVADDEDSSGLLNNLAWVLATSPQDAVRDGQRSVEYAKKSAELSEYKEAHILSTLAAAYAESGNFEEAIKWSEKAVELGRADENEQLEQLEKELESYRRNEPWREKQETEENKVPLVAPEDIINT